MRYKFRKSIIKENLTGYLFIFPAVLIITMFGFFPIGYAIYMSLYNWRVRKGPFVGAGNYSKALGDWQGIAYFVIGFVLIAVAYWLWTSAFRSRSNLSLFLKILAALLLIAGLVYLIPHGWGMMETSGDDDFLASLPITLFYSITSVPVELAVALVLAYILFQKIRGKEFFRMIFFLPYITPAVATAVVFRTIFNHD
jgi:multiple sugar transport system permease protein